MKNLRTQIMVALLGAMAFGLMYLDFALPHIFPEYLKYDLGDVPALIAAFLFGPGAGVAAQFIKVVLYALLKGGTSGPIGWLANFLAGASLVWVAGWVHQRWGRWTGDLAALALGSLAMAAVMLAVNTYLIFPLYMQTDISTSFQLALTVSTPFNLFKGAASTAVTALAYRKLAEVLTVLMPKGRPA